MANMTDDEWALNGTLHRKYVNPFDVQHSADEPQEVWMERVRREAYKFPHTIGKDDDSVRAYTAAFLADLRATAQACSSVQNNARGAHAQVPSDNKHELQAQVTAENMARKKPYVVNVAKRKCKCRGPKAECASHNQIAKGALRLGSRGTIDDGAHETLFWRHLECVTQRMLHSKGVRADNMDDFFEFQFDLTTRDGVDKKQEACAALCAVLQSSDQVSSLQRAESSPITRKRQKLC